MLLTLQSAVEEIRDHDDRDLSAMAKRAAHGALRSLTGQDFGPRDGSPEERARAAAAWKAWWQGQRSR